MCGMYVKYVWYGMYGREVRYGWLITMGNCPRTPCLNDIITPSHSLLSGLHLWCLPPWLTWMELKLSLQAGAWPC